MRGEIEGELCESCMKENALFREQIKELIKDGHPKHCAMRQVYGDGECECDLYEKGYDPYSWEG